MADFSNLPNFHLKLVFVIHFMLISLACIGYWAPSSYLFYNFVLIIVLLWAIHKNDSDEPLQLCIFINGMSVILDIIIISMRFPDSHAGSERFSAALSIIHLIIRPFTTIFLVKLLQERSPTPGSGIANLFTGHVIVVMRIWIKILDPSYHHRLRAKDMISPPPNKFKSYYTLMIPQCLQSLES